jgi:hypothetical protein
MQNVPYDQCDENIVSFIWNNKLQLTDLFDHDLTSWHMVSTMGSLLKDNSIQRLLAVIFTAYAILAVSALPLTMLVRSYCARGLRVGVPWYKCYCFFKSLSPCTRRRQHQRPPLHSATLVSAVKCAVHRVVAAFSLRGLQVGTDRNRMLKLFMSAPMSAIKLLARRARAALDNLHQRRGEEAAQESGAQKAEAMDFAGDDNGDDVRLY